MSTCIRCAWCDGYPCLVHAKSDAEVIAVRPLLGRGNVTLLCGAEVTMLETDPSGRSITGVVVTRDGERELYVGDIVVISAGADPATSVLDVNCKAHELDNLYVVDTSFFPGIGAVTPALTAMANAIRVGQQIADRIS